MSQAQAQLTALATNAALLRRSGSELNAEVGVHPTAAPTVVANAGASVPTSQAQLPLPGTNSSNSSKALIHALECLQNKIKSMEAQKAAMVSDFESQKTRCAGELAELKLLCSSQEQELAELRRYADGHVKQARTSEQAAVDAWEKTGVLNAALARANAQVEQVSQQLQLRDGELATMREQLSRASDAVSDAGNRAAEYSDRVTETVSELSQARAELHAARLESEAAQERASVAERMLQELRDSAAAAAEAEKNERTRAEQASASLHSILNLSAHAAAELPHELQHGAYNAARPWIADPLTDAAQLSASQIEPQPEPQQNRCAGQEVTDKFQPFGDMSVPGTSMLGPHSSGETELSGGTAAATMAASAATATAAQQMGPRIPGLPGYYLDVQAKLDPKYKQVRERAEKTVRNSQHIWVPAGPALSDGRRTPLSPNSRHATSIHSSDTQETSPDTSLSKTRKPRGRGRSHSRRPASAPAHRPRMVRAASTRPSTSRPKRKGRKGGSSKQQKDLGASKSNQDKSTQPYGQPTNVKASEAIARKIDALAAACGGGESVKRQEACERLIATTRAEIDVCCASKGNNGLNVLDAPSAAEDDTTRGS